MLSIRDLGCAFGGVRAVDGLSCDIREGCVTALIGPNGAGKTTAINLTTGVLRPTQGDVLLDGVSLLSLKMHERAAAGIARTYQTPQLVPGMSALENVMAGAHRFGRFGFLQAWCTPWKGQREEGVLRSRAMECLRQVGLDAVCWEQAADGLAFGHQRLVEIARALAQEPRVILLDEPAAGLNAVETAALGELLVSLARADRAILLVEHDMPLVMSTARHIVVLNFGRKIAEGTPEQIRGDPQVIKAYLGAPDTAAREPRAENTGDAVLTVDAVTAGYGHVQVLHGVSLQVRAGEIVSLVGANGAGKSTLLNVISGFIAPTAGDVRLESSALGRMRPAAIARSGIRQVPEGRRVFADLTVMENLQQGGWGIGKAALDSAAESVFQLFPRLQERQDQLGGTLSGGEQQMLAIGRALMWKPKVLMLDEPSMGLAPLIVAEIFQLLERLRAEWGLSILLVEQNAGAAMRISDRAYVLELGRITLSGAARELEQDPRVTASFLGAR